eukprot:2480911-Karenia_brevis.AAC.1
MEGKRLTNLLRSSYKEKSFFFDKEDGIISTGGKRLILLNVVDKRSAPTLQWKTKWAQTCGIERDLIEREFGA